MSGRADVPEATQHDTEALVSNPGWVQLNYRPAAQIPSPRTWYSSDPACLAAAPGQNCDEYLFFAPEVMQALTGYEQRLRDLGAPVVDRLRPGLARIEIDRLGNEFDVVLSGDAAAWWMWHVDRRRREISWRRHRSGRARPRELTVVRCGLVSQI